MYIYFYRFYLNTFKTISELNMPRDRLGTNNLYTSFYLPKSWLWKPFLRVRRSVTFLPTCTMTDLASNPCCSPGTWYKKITTLCGHLGRAVGPLQCWTLEPSHCIVTLGSHCHFTGALGTYKIG